MPDKNHQSTKRCLDILELLSRKPSGCTFTEIHEALNIPKSSAFPIIHTLWERDYITYHSDTSRYQIGSMAFRVGNTFLSGNNIMEEVQSELQRIVNESRETSHFATLSGGENLYLKKVDSPEAIRMLSMVGRQLPAYSTAVGKALLADYSLDRLRLLYPDALRPLTQNTIRSVEQLYEQLEQVRKEGFAYEIEESNHYIRCIAIPLRWRAKIVAAISVAIPTFRYTDERAEIIKMLLVNSKQRIEKLLENLDYLNFL